MAAAKHKSHSETKNSPANSEDAIFVARQNPRKISNSIMKWLFFALLLVGVGIFSESINDNEKFIPSVNQIEMGSKNHFVSQDIYKLYEEGKIPKTFFKLRKINWTYYDPDLKKEIPTDSLPFRQTSGGLYNLEIDAFSSPGEKTKNTILQMSLIEIKSGNKVWEMSRNYEIPIKKNRN